MTYISLYRKWRPQTFQDVIGQAHVTKTLQNALAMGRIGHAYLFSGPRGTGKTTVAKILAKALNCQQGPSPEPCDQCDNCRQIREGVSMDVVEIDGASNRGIDEIRDLREKVRFVPSQGRYKVYIIDEVHMLTTEAFNALLKTLEEPPQHVVFVFATTEPHKVPATIISRCQSFEFHRIALTDLMKRLAQVSEAEGLKVSEAALNLIARSAQGGLRDALSILDQCIAFSGTEIAVEDVKELLGVVEFDLLTAYTGAIQKGDLVKALASVEEVLSLGKDLTQFVSALLDYWRDLLVYKATGQEPEEYTIEEREQLKEQADRFELAELTEMLGIMGETLPEVRRYQSKLPLELASIKICHHKGEGREPAKPETLEIPKRPEKPAPLEKEPAGVQVEGKWAEFLRFLKKKRFISLQALLRDADPQFNGKKLWLVYKPEMTFHRDNINKNKKELEKALAEFYQQDLEAEAVCGNPPEPASQAEPVRDKIEVDDPIVQKAVEIFGASVVKIEEN
ncbi:MAG: DNA polymerase III subunit gamma/tau [Firmicutes bacterium]|nr:DNA polymerase III subunit gamma/tau [Bacillota bacterium]